MSVMVDGAPLPSKGSTLALRPYSLNESFTSYHSTLLGVRVRYFFIRTAERAVQNQENRMESTRNSGLKNSVMIL